MSDQNRLVLAYSGGLDTSVAISYLKERTGKDVVAVSLDVGQGGESLETIKQRALACGAVEAYVVDARDEFANEYCMKALKANALYEGVYPLVSAISRPLISKHLVRAAHQFGADTISHGCTGKGNGQVRFEVSKFGRISQRIFKDFTKAERIMSFNMPIMMVCVYHHELQHADHDGVRLRLDDSHRMDGRAADRRFRQ